MKARNGFTLLELTAAIGITSALAIIAAPSFIDMLSNSRMTAINNEVAGALNFTRSEAIKRSTTIGAYLNQQYLDKDGITTKEASIIVKQTDCNSVDCFLRIYDNLPEFFTVSAVKLQGINENNVTPVQINSINFSSQGTTGAIEYVKICSQGKIKVVSISHLGRISSVKDTNNNGTLDIVINETLIEIPPCPIQ